jgi:hypothetical protein
MVVVGLEVVSQTTPRWVIGEPPVLVIAPPEVAAVLIILLTGKVVRDGKLLEPLGVLGVFVISSSGLHEEKKVMATNAVLAINKH